MKRIYLLMILLFCLNLVHAHQPRLVDQLESSIENPLAINNPEISQAFYGNLKGVPDYYLISKEESFEFYLGILSPEVSDAKTDFIANIEFDGQNLILEKSDVWDSFYEEFAGDNYFSGPEISFEAEAGEYLIKISNPENQGKYVLVVGKIESFPLKETINTYLLLPRMKMYFEKSPLTAYFNLISIPLWIILAIIIAITIIIIKMKKKSKKKRI